jgi:hypothetical protein
MAVSSAGLRLKCDCSGKAQKQLYSKLQTRPLVRESATKQQSRSCLKEISWRKKNWSKVPDGRLTPGQTGRLTVGRKLTQLNSTQSESESESQSTAVSVNSVNIVHSVNKVVNPHKGNYHYVGVFPHKAIKTLKESCSGWEPKHVVSDTW